LGSFYHFYLIFRRVETSTLYVGTYPAVEGWEVIHLKINAVRLEYCHFASHFLFLVTDIYKASAANWRCLWMKKASISNTGKTVLCRRIFSGETNVIKSMRPWHTWPATL